MSAFIDNYLTRFLTTGRKETPFSCDLTDTNQLRLEKRMRALAARHEPFTPPAMDTVRPGAESPLGQPWRFNHACGNIFIDDSSFYVDLCRVELHAATVLRTPRPMRLSARLWSYDAADVWLNGALTATLPLPCYKPIRWVDFTLELPAGDSQLYIRLETLGVRDTRFSFALELPDRPAELEAVLPGCDAYLQTAQLLDSTRLEGDTLVLPQPLPEGSTVRYHTGEKDFRKKDQRFVVQQAGGLAEVPLQPYAGCVLSVPVEGDGAQALYRRFERIALKGPQFLNSIPASPEKNRRRVIEEIAKVASIIREETDGFALYPMLARRYLGQDLASDHEELRVTLAQIERRMDCADFMTCALIRLMKEYELPEEIMPEIKRVMLSFRYWMDEPGQDGMCFWSENHTMMFFQTAYFFGELWPEEIFTRSGKTGAQLREQAKTRLGEWLRETCAHGFDEFNSGVYSSITFSALLNVVDYAEPELARLAWQACDGIVRMMALHCFKNIVISPGGREYHGVLSPWRSSLQALVQWVRPEAPYVYNDWLSAFATTRYQMPEDLEALMEKTGSFTYESDNAVIDLYKTAGYALTSVQSPRQDGKSRAWQPDEREEVKDHFIYVRSLNEHFHGTTEFQPGEFGYQQHLWQAALAQDLVVFVNHPGQSCEAMSEVRPGYWYGNGILPALRQEKNVLGAVYAIPESYPIRFTHLYWDSVKFDEQFTEQGWLFGRKGDSYIGVWCSVPLADHDDVMFGCEKRANAAVTAWLVVCGSAAEQGGFTAFCRDCLARDIVFDHTALTLTCAEFTLQNTPGQNGTQTVE